MVDYSKWKNIEVSDDEDDTHPNIDTPSLFRWRHQARLERMEQSKKEKNELEKEKSSWKKLLEETRQKINLAEKNNHPNLESLKIELEQLIKQEEEFHKKEEELAHKEKLTPWNVDTLSQDGFTKTVINVGNPVAQEELTEEQRQDRIRAFVHENEKLLKCFGMLQRFDDSKRFLQENPQLVCEDAANYLVIWCINLEMEEKHDLMSHVAHQTICLQYILELAHELERDPRACVAPFFNRIQLADEQYVAAFKDELESFQERVKKRAATKLEEALRQQEEEERQQRLGPGGLDPVEVMESLPDDLRKCFETRDTESLQKVISQLDPKEATYHMKRCVDSGLWIPNANASKENEESEQPEY